MGQPKRIFTTVRINAGPMQAHKLHFWSLFLFFLWFEVSFMENSVRKEGDGCGSGWWRWMRVQSLLISVGHGVRRYKGRRYTGNPSANQLCSIAFRKPSHFLESSTHPWDHFAEVFKRQRIRAVLVQRRSPPVSMQVSLFTKLFLLKIATEAALCPSVS